MKTSPFATAFVRIPLAGSATLDNLTWEKIAQLVGDKAFREALYMASPALYDEAGKLDFSRQPDQKDRRVVYSLIKYLSRYATRCTPFGLFGGFSTLPLGSGPTQVHTDTRDTLRKVVRLDMNYLCALAQDLERHEAIRPYLRFYPNSSVYTLNNQYRYVAYRYDEAGRRVHHLSSTDQNPYVDTLLTQAKRGTTVGEMASALVSHEVTADEAEAFVAQVLETQLLVSELEPSLTGDDFLTQILTLLTTLGQTHSSAGIDTITALLSEIRADLKAIGQRGAADASVGKYAAIEAKLSQLATPFDRKVLFQVDAYLPQTTGYLNQGLLNKLVAKLPTLMKLVPHQNSILKEFRHRFTDKYEDEEIPLVVALDPEIGIGFPAGSDRADPSPLIDTIPMGGPAPASRTVSISTEQEYLLRKVAEAQVSGAVEIRISEDDLRAVEPKNTALPLTNSAMFSVIREGGKEMLVLDNFGGATGAFLLGRFGHTDESVKQLLTDISRAEDAAQPDAIFADIVHLPEARTGNILIRPALKAYQIPYLGKASVDADHQIPVSDLLVSIRGSRVVLRSRSLNREVIPRLANAHNYSNSDSLDIYHFLCALQYQGIRGQLGDVLGGFSSLFVFLPRIVLDGIILSEARWNGRAAQIAPVVSAFKRGHWLETQAELERWREQYRIPQHICLVDGDNELYVDLANQWLAETFLNELKSREAFVIKEFLFRAGNAVVQSRLGWHTNQFVVAFRNEPEPIRPDQRENIAEHATQLSKNQVVTRQFFVGSEWLYYKIYTGLKTADTLLSEVLHPLIERLLVEGRIEGFFFIRYADPHGHFRIRFHLTNPEQLGAVVGELHQCLAPFVANKSVTAIVSDTYKRELERYGPNTIDLVESFFHTDSQAILRFLSQIEGTEGEECRWRFGLKLTDDLLTMFGLDLVQKVGFTEQQVAYFGREFGYNALVKKQLDLKHRALEPALAELFAETNEDHEFFYALCRERVANAQTFVQTIQNLAKKGQLQLPLDSLLGSLVHMTTNRLFRSRQRFVEFSMYYHLHKFYRVLYGRTVLARKPVINELVLAN